MYPAPLRDLLIELAAANLFRARWTAQIQDEWIRNLLKNRPDLKPEQLSRTNELMEIAVPDCLIVGYEPLIEALKLPDPDDRHVLAAAIRGGCHAIITTNLKHFPDEALKPWNIEAQHPDEFIHHQLGLNQANIIVAAQRCRRRLKNPPVSAEQYLETLHSLELPVTVSELAPFSGVL